MFKNHKIVAMATGVVALGAVSAAAFLIRVTSQELPTPAGLAPPTPTPDLRNAVSPSEAVEALRESPPLGRLISAFEQGDVQTFLDLVDWQPQRCGLQNTDTCPEDVEPYTELPMVEVGFPIPFWVTADTLKPTLELVMSGEPLAPRIVTRSKSDTGDYHIAFVAGPKGVGLLPLAAPDQQLTGLFLVVDESSSRPVVRLHPVSDQWTATAHAQALGLTGREIVVWEQGY